MSIRATRDTEPLLAASRNRTLQQSKSCRLTYKPRRVTSKGAVLNLLWNFMVFASTNDPVKTGHVGIVYTLVSYIALILAAVSSAWLADTRLGRRRVVQAGFIVLWFGSLLHATANVTEGVYPRVSDYLSYPSTAAVYAGEVAILINIIQFGIEQMPDASAEQITAFISWYALTIPAGIWVYFLIHTLCEPFRSLLGYTLLSIVLCSHFLCKHWLIDHRSTQHPLRTIYRVLKYAKQHKCPVDRSAFTYWEEEIPSRIDLGKSKYGGPFTTEEVEDVKTILRVVAILATLTLFIATGTLTFAGFLLLQSWHTSLQASAISGCVQLSLHEDVLNGYLEAAVVILLYELLFYPVFKHHIPSMLKRIGACTLANVAASVLLLVITTTAHFNTNVLPYIQSSTWIPIVGTIILALLGYTLATATFEFINAQTPESMKGAASTIPYLAVFFAVLVGVILKVSIIVDKCRHHLCPIIVATACVLLSAVASSIYCLVAKWYKRRERDELFNAQAIIEDIYSRRVEQNDTDQ